MTADPTELRPSAADRPERRGVLRFAPLLLIVGAIAAILLSGAHRYLSFDALLDHWSALTGFVAENRVSAAMCFVAAFITFVVLSLPGASVFSMTSGLLFGALAGGALSVLAGTAGAMIVFLAARTALGDFLARRAGSLLQRIAAGFQRDAFNYLLFLRVVPAFPFWVINLAPALLGVPLRTYAAATAIGVIPGTFAFAFIGAGLKGFMAEHSTARAACLAAGQGDCHVAFHPMALVSPTTLAGLGALGLLALVPILIRRFAGNRRAKASEAQ